MYTIRKSNSRVRFFSLPISYRLREYMLKMYLAIFQERTQKISYTNSHGFIFALSINRQRSKKWTAAQRAKWKAKQMKPSARAPQKHENWIRCIDFSIKLNAIGNVHGRNALNKQIVKARKKKKNVTNCFHYEMKTMRIMSILHAIVKSIHSSAKFIETNNARTQWNTSIQQPTRFRWNSDNNNKRILLFA